MVTVRDARVADADVLALLNRAFNGVTRDDEHIRHALQAQGSTEAVLVAEEAGAVVGFLCLQTLQSICYDAPWVEITELYVAPSHRGHGAGCALVREAERRAVKAGASELLLRTNTRNGPAHSLFNRVGLEPAPQLVFRRSYGRRGLTRACT
jgi:ribosomal protein S18 acetylase RimI-like enzyme